MQKRAWASSSSGQPSQPKRRCVPPIDRAWNGSEANLVRCCCLTKEDVRSVCTEVLERAKSDWAECIQSCLQNALKDILPQMLSEIDSQILKEAVESAYSRSLHLRRGNAKSTANNGARNLKLQLSTKLSRPIYTENKIEGEGGVRIHVALLDVNTGEVVTSGPESSIKLDVVVLEGDFNKDDEDNWLPEEFENYVVKEREGKGPLLAGDLVVKLKEGVGELGEFIFTDNSSWNRSKTFRIGFKVASGFCVDTRIQEAITDPFPVKAHRGEAYKKHHPPASDDDVWRLENIAKDGKSHRKLSEAGIYKVEDFLLQVFTDPTKLRGILGKSITKNKWESLVRHAKTCKTKWRLYLDYTDGMTQHGAVFNNDGQPIGLIQDREYFATHRLSALQKEQRDTIVKKALANWNYVREFSSETFSDLVQKSNSSSFLSEVFSEQIENVNPVQHYLALSVSAAPAGLQAYLANVSSTAEGINDTTDLALPDQSQNINCGYSMGIAVDEILHHTPQQLVSADRLNKLIPPECQGVNTAGLPTSSHVINLQNATHSQMICSSSQMDCTGYDNIQPSEPSYPSVSSFHSSRALPPPKGNHTIEDPQLISRENGEELFAENPPYDYTFDRSLPPPEGDHFREDSQFIDLDDLEIWLAANPPRNGNKRGVLGWLKIKAMLQWGFFIKKSGVKLVELDSPPIEVQACS